MLQRTYAKKPAPTDSSPSPNSDAFSPRPFVARAKTRAPGVGMPPSADAEARAAIRSGGGRPIADPVRRRMEAALGHDFGSVRVHADDAQAPRIGALAFARGEHLHFAPGAYRPENAAGRRVLGHELAHVVQQRERRVRPNRSGPLPLNDDPALEREADAHGFRAVRGDAPRAGAAAIMAAPATASPAPAGPVQMIPWWKKALYGAGIAGGAALAGTAALASAPLLAATGAVAAVGSGVAAYREHAGEQREAARREKLRRAQAEIQRRQREAEAREQAELKRTGNARATSNLANLRQLHAGLGRSGNDPLLHQVLGEALAHTGPRGVATVTGGSAHPRGEATRDAADRSAYTVRLDDRITDPHQRHSYLLHELTHVSADRRYSMNAPGMTEFYNQPDRGGSDARRRKFLDKRATKLAGHARTAQGLARADQTLPQEERDYLHQRLQYAVDKPNIEHDTVVNELLLYAHTKRLPRNSPTVRKIRQLARKAQRRRTTTYARTGR